MQGAKITKRYRIVLKQIKALLNIEYWGALVYCLLTPIIE